VEIAQDAGGGSYNARSATVANLRAGLATSGAVTGTGITMATARLLGRTTASTGAIEEISVSGLGLTGGTLSQGAGASAKGFFDDPHHTQPVDRPGRSFRELRARLGPGRAERQQALDGGAASLPGR
jgi:hypothetical protein